VGISEMLSDVKAHFEQGAELAASHIPALVAWAEKADADPLVQAAIGLVVPESTKTMLAGLLKSVEAEVAAVEAKAAAEATAEAQAAAAPADPAAAPVTEAAEAPPA
jgi:hypothetical protein